MCVCVSRYSWDASSRRGGVGGYVAGASPAPSVEGSGSYTPTSEGYGRRGRAGGGSTSGAYNDPGVCFCLCVCVFVCVLPVVCR